MAVFYKNWINFCNVTMKNVLFFRNKAKKPLDFRFPQRLLLQHLPALRRTETALVNGLLTGLLHHPPALSWAKALPFAAQVFTGGTFPAGKVLNRPTRAMVDWGG